LPLLGAGANGHSYAVTARVFVVIIKKYPNRRLYDTENSQYVNLEYIKSLVMSHNDFKIIDSKTEDDLTKSILLQIISEQETNENQSVLTHQVLKQLIRFYDSDMQMFLRVYLEQSMANFLDQQDAMQTVMRNIMDVNPVNVFGQMLEKNMDFWRTLAQQENDKSSKE
jgi:polyhydroxyalkanoate synthesis repressor PhaR